jgi:hypothetical protein
MGPTDGATAADTMVLKETPVQFPDSHSTPTSSPVEFPCIELDAAIQTTSTAKAVVAGPRNHEHDTAQKLFAGGQHSPAFATDLTRLCMGRMYATSS